MSKWPKFAHYEEFVGALPRILERALRYSRISRRYGVQPEEVYSRMLGKIQKNWHRIPKQVGQATYLWQIFRSCLFDELKAISRSTILADPGKPWASQSLDVMSETAIVDSDRGLDFREVAEAIEKLQKDYPVHTRILALRGVFDCKWAEISAAVGLCQRTCQNYYRDIRSIFCERYPHLRELLNET